MERFIFFDLDGTLIESAGIKTNAFRSLFSDSPQVEKIVRYHLEHAGVSRYDKFDHIYKNILHKELSPSEKKRLGGKFSELVLEEILRAPLVKGTEEFLEKHCKADRLYVVSSTPHNELIFIMGKRGLAKYFRGIYGAPKKKSASVTEVLAANPAQSSSAVLVGDSIEDMKEAKIAGIRFIGRIADRISSEFPAGVTRINDLTGLEGALEGPE